MHRRRLLALAVILTALAATTGTGGYTSTAADRGLGVAVLEDDRMLLGVDTAAPDLAAGSHEDVVLLEIRNQFGADTTLSSIDAEVATADATPAVTVHTETVATPDELAGGGSGAVTVDVECTGEETATESVTVTVTAADDTQRFTATRETTVTCRTG